MSGQPGQNNDQYGQQSGDQRRRGGPIGMLIRAAGTGVGMAAEYREHRKSQKLSRENSQQDANADDGPSSTTPKISAREEASSDLPPAYADVADGQRDRSLASGKPASDDKKAALAQYDDHDEEEEDSSSDDDLDSIEEDEEDWELDEIQERSLPSYAESEKHYGNTDELVQEVMKNKPAATAPSQSFARTPLPCPVIIPQRRPRAKARGFIHAYPPLLGECSGIDQDTFVSFLDNFYKSSQASPVFTVLNIAATGVGFVPEPTAQAVSIVVQFAAGFGKEIDSRKKTNNFLDKMNEELFKPAGLYAMIVKYKTDKEVAESGNSLLSRLGVSPEKVDFNTNQSIAKYSRTLSDDSTSSAGSKGITEKLKDIRLASGTTRGVLKLPEAAPLIFPEIDKAVIQEGPETFKDKAKDAQSFVADYLDRRAQLTYAKDDPNSNLQVPKDQYAFKSKYADPSHPMYNSGIVGFVSGGHLTGSKSDRRRRRDKRERRVEKYERRMDERGYLSAKKQRKYDRYVGEQYRTGGWNEAFAPPPPEQGYENAPAPHAPYGGSGYGGGFGGRGRGGRRGRGSPIGLVGGLVRGVVSGVAGHGSNSNPNPGNQQDQQYGSRSREYEDAHSGSREASSYNDPRTQRRSFDDRGYGAGVSAEDRYNDSRYSAYGQSGHAAYGGQNYRGGQDARRRRGGPIGLVKRIMREDVLYLMIVNMPSESELEEARQEIAKAKAKSH